MTIDDFVARRPPPPPGFERWFPFAAIILLVSVYLAVRLASLDSMIQTDEVDWLGGAANVYTGVAHGDLSATYQLPHPGATTLWAGVLAYITEIPEYPSLRDTPVPYHRVDLVLRELGYDPMSLLITARIYKLLFQAALFALALVLLRRIAGLGVTALAGLLIVFDPFTLGYDRLLHIDGLVSIAAFAATIAIASATAADRPSSRRLWALAGFLCGVAWLTRFTAGVLVLIAAIAIVSPLITALIRRRSGDRKRVGGEVVSAARWFTISALLTTIALWPTIVVNPAGTLEKMWDYVSNAVSSGHELPVFYNGEIIRGDLGHLFYLDAIFWRLTPVVLIGLIAFVVALIAQPRRVTEGGRLSLLLCCSGFVVTYTLLMDEGAKKFDRYILPVLLPLSLIAAIGIVSLLEWLAKSESTSRARQVLTAVACIVIATAQVATWIPHTRYGLDYFNPLRGGVVAAEASMQIGAGEGLDQAAAFILEQPGGAESTVISQNNQVTLMYLLPPTATVINSGLRADARGLIAWSEADYYVSYLPQWQRDLSAMVEDHAVRYDPIHEVTIDGVAYSCVYDVRGMPPPPAIVEGLTCAWDYANGASLLTYRDQSVRSESDARNTRRLSLYFVSGSSESAPLIVRLVPRVRNLDEIELTGVLPPSAADGTITSVDLDFTLPRGNTTDAYDIEVEVRDPQTNRPVVASPATRDLEETGAATANACDGAGIVN